MCIPSFFRSFIRDRSLNVYEVPGTGAGAEDAAVNQSRRGLPPCLLQSNTVGSDKYSGVARSLIYLVAFSLLHLQFNIASAFFMYCAPFLLVLSTCTCPLALRVDAKSCDLWAIFQE